MENLLQQGINAAKTGDRIRAFQLLSKATQDRATAEQAWLWLAGVLKDDAERLFCLDNALRINPNNGPAKSKATEFRQKGIFPAAPTPPQSPPPVVAAPIQQAPTPQTPIPQPVTISQPVQKVSSMPSKPVEKPVTDTGRQQDLSGLVRFAAQELSRKQPPAAVVKKLTEQGVTTATAEQVVAETQKLLNKAVADKHKKRMSRGLVWLVIGIILTCGTMAFSDSMGGKYVFFYGAIIWGFIDFIIGLFGWLSNR